MLHTKTHMAAQSQTTWGWTAAVHWPSAVKTQDIALLFYYIESRAQPHTELQHIVQKTPKHCYEGYFYSYPGKFVIFHCPTEPAQTSTRTQLTGRRENILQSMLQDSLEQHYLFMQKIKHSNLSYSCSLLQHGWAKPTATKAGGL